MSKHDTVSADTTATTLSVSATATAAPASTDITEWGAEKKKKTFEKSTEKISVINRKLIEINKVKLYHKTGLVYLAGKDNVVKRIGTTKPLELKYNGKTFHHSFEIMDFNEDDKSNVILGLDILSHLGIALTGVAHNWDDNEVIFDDSIDDTVKPNNSPAGTEHERTQFIEKIQPLLTENMNMPKDAFCTVPESIIHLTTEKGKIVNHKQYPIAYKLKPVLDEAMTLLGQVKQMGCHHKSQ
ncbi:hypothetical protein G6F16_010203 [Rhizopus arrhizus]|nr:hypothetical protein G6F24_010042 [Rhizopus arrhizus]KAG0798803.1 hypothetical protein G6F22_003857 [Rhizopus arrhizus]KAG0814237.1 hypothetical protein G6F20_004928 [Rhizopus arrhizus]KAG0827554.1 hypothetical protein G6F18_009447 [Rhizopus arrhizus]KAG0841910.1 hypothetical protein G6F19_001303 [Rhizopus arrhizus]